MEAWRFLITLLSNQECSPTAVVDGFNAWRDLGSNEFVGDA